ncbi:carbohydrate ABC transporter permease [Shimia sediminis]|uniref:carbohydrate ABC transporter permease n=1 Tax=Shimia sediminis TaxID=2497945 RepID=UPI000F8C8CD7|nr:carbohydrate ABC transporter permease [Shimia sediminis]
MSLTRKQTEDLQMVLRGAAIALVITVFLGPILWIMLTAFKPLSDVYTMALFFEPTLDNFRQIFERPFFLGSKLTNSVIISTFTVLIGIPCALLAAYSFSRFPFRNKKLMFFGVLATQFVPPMVVILPIFLMFRTLGLLDTKIGMIWINLSIVLPFSIWMLKGFVDSIPVEMEEAALVDGASRFRVIKDIVLPVCVPGLFITGIFCFIFSWNDFLHALILTRKEAVTLPVTLGSFLTEEGERWELMAATGTIILLPMFAISYFIQRHFVHGATSGSDR